MKKVFLFFLFGWSSSFFIHAQEGWFDNNPQWVNAIHSFLKGPGVEYISVQGDTVVDGYAAKVLRRFEDFDTGNDRTLIRVARQNGDTIWCLNHPAPGINYFHIQYNFSLGIGDSIALPPYYSGIPRIKYFITATGTSVINGQSLRYQDVDLYYNDVYRCNARIMEKIGLVNTGCPYNGPDPRLWQWEHFFVDEPNEFFIDGQQWFFCKFQNDLMEFEQEDNLCSGLTQTVGPDLAQSYYRIVPNPFTDHFYLEAENTHDIRLLRIFNASGQLMLEVKNPHRWIATASLRPGVYFIELLSKIGNQHFLRAVKI